MKRISVLTIALILLITSGTLATTQKTFIAGPLKYEKNYRNQKETNFYIGRVRVGHFNWFPSILIMGENISESEGESCRGKDVLVFGDYTRIPVDPSQQLAVDSWPAMVAKIIVPAKSKYPGP